MKTDFLLFLEQYNSLEIYKQADKAIQEVMYEYYKLCGKMIGYAHIDVDRLIQNIYKINKFGLQELPKFNVNTDESIINMFEYSVQ